MRALLPIYLTFALFWPSLATAEGNRWTMRVGLGNLEVEGMPLAWSKQHVFILARDGRLWDLAPEKARNFRKTSSYFTSYTFAEIRAGLERELGGRLQITGTGHYLVAHPPGRADIWAPRFEELYRSCVHYFNQREMKVREPDFPLVAIVWPRRDDFVRYATLEGNKPRPDVLGLYSPITNRVTLYDQGENGSGSMWRQNDATIIHEVTHQVAFNTGVHNRFVATPVWLAEGLGTLFEAPGVWNWRNYQRLSDRVNRERLAQFRQWLKSGRATGSFANLLVSDRQFQSNPAAAYAESWAWALFLTETYPKKFSQYVQRTASRPEFQEYPLAQRLSDFTGLFGEDLRTLEAHFLRFIAGLD